MQIFDIVLIDKNNLMNIRGNHFCQYGNSVPSYAKSSLNLALLFPLLPMACLVILRLDITWFLDLLTESAFQL